MGKLPLVAAFSGIHTCFEKRLCIPVSIRCSLLVQLLHVSVLFNIVSQIFFIYHKLQLQLLQLYTEIFFIEISYFSFRCMWQVRSIFFLNTSKNRLSSYEGLWKTRLSPLLAASEVSTVPILVITFLFQLLYHSSRLILSGFRQLVSNMLFFNAILEQASNVLQIQIWERSF